MEIAQKLIDETDSPDFNGEVVNPMDSHFESLGLKFMDHIRPDSQELTQLQDYVTSTHGHTHGGYQGKILQAFRVERHDEEKSWSEAGHNKLADGERLLLWHGSRSTNFAGRQHLNRSILRSLTYLAGILKQGLRIAPPEAPSTGYMFGKARLCFYHDRAELIVLQGVYFADVGL
jgi:poly [ADP-ribose] polymerase